MKFRAATLLLPIIYLGFISLGLPDGTLGVAWPRLHRDLSLPISMAGVFLVVATLLAAAAGFSSGRIIARFKTAPLVIFSCGLTGSGLLIIAQAQSLTALLLAAVPLGLGAGAVDAALNGYVARHYEARHMNWLHACWGLGATGGPLVLAHTLTTNWSWRGGFAVLGAAQLGLGLLFLVTLRLWSRVPQRSYGPPAETTGAHGGVCPRATADSWAGWLSAIIFVLYVAAEGTTGVWAATVLVESRGVPAPIAGLCAAAFYGAITVGRIAVGFVAERWGNRRLTTLGLGLAAVGAALFAAPVGGVQLWAVALVAMGLGFAPVYPCLMHEVPRRFTPEAVQTIIGRQSGSGAFGSATLPAAAGLLSYWSLELISWAIIASLLGLAWAIRRLNRIT